MKLSNPVVRVILGDVDDEASWREVEVQTVNADMVAFDLERNRRGWPEMGKAAPLWLTFVSYRALTRRGEFAGSFKDYEAAVLEVGTPDVGDGEAVETDADPTLPALEND